MSKPEAEVWPAELAVRWGDIQWGEPSVGAPRRNTNTEGTTLPRNGHRAEHEDSSD